MDNSYIHGLRQHDARPRSPVIVPHNLSELRKKILFENTLLEERALHEFSAGKGDGAGVDTGSAPLAPATAPAPFPASITLTGTYSTMASPQLFPISNLNQISFFSELGSLADESVPYRIYLSTAPNLSDGIDYLYMIYLRSATAGYYSANISAGRWLIGIGGNFQGDNSGYYVNFGFYTALQSKSTPPSSNIANWTRLPGSYPNEGTITGIAFNY